RGGLPGGWADGAPWPRGGLRHGRRGPRGATGPSLRAPWGGREAALQPVALRLQRGFVRDGDLLRVRQLVEQEVRDLAARIRAAAPPLRRQRRDRLVDGGAGVRPELAERFEQLQPLFEPDGEGVEVAH